MAICSQHSQGSSLRSSRLQYRETPSAAAAFPTHLSDRPHADGRSPVVLKRCSRESAASVSIVYKTAAASIPAFSSAVRCFSAIFSSHHADIHRPSINLVEADVFKTRDAAEKGRGRTCSMVASSLDHTWCAQDIETRLRHRSQSPGRTYHRKRPGNARSLDTVPPYAAQLAQERRKHILRSG